MIRYILIVKNALQKYKKIELMKAIEIITIDALMSQCRSPRNHSEHQRKHGGIVVFYKCNDYDFTEYENFIADGKTEIEYII
jgi:hypothetical protein